MAANKKDASLTDAFYSWLTLNTDLVKYIQIDSIVLPTNPEEKSNFDKQRKEMELVVLGDLTNFLNLCLLTKKPHMPSEFPPAPPNSSKLTTKIAIEIRFLQMEEYRYRKEHFDDSVRKINTLIDFLSQENSIPESITIKIATAKLFADLSKTPTRADQCLKLYEKKIFDLCSIINKDLESPGPNETLLYIFGLCIPRFNNALHFMELNSQQDRFNYWLFSPTHPIANEIGKFLENFQSWPRKNFTNEVFNLFEALKRYFPQADPILGSILVIMYFRAIFDAAISINYEYFFPETESKAALIRDDILINDITPPKELLPPHREDEPARAVFNRDIRYRAAGQHVTAAFFQTNPLDVLYEIHLALKEMHVGIAAKRKPADARQVLPFETIFTVFFGSLLTAEIPNLEGLVNFIKDFAPAGRLAPEFQYAQVTMTAVIAQFDTFYHEKRKTVL